MRSHDRQNFTESPQERFTMRFREHVCLFWLLAVTLLTTVPTLKGQVNTVGLSGRVLDPQEAAVPGAGIT
ncbi:MAG: hypothetical protein HYS61_03095, partial [Acidobacteria bacterium]|nr:hypothetical protein [Acidobacteriota bacterium]